MTADILSAVVDGIANAMTLAILFGMAHAILEELRPR